MKPFFLGSLLAAAVSANPMSVPTPVSSTGISIPRVPGGVKRAYVTYVQPGIPSASTALSQLAALTVQAAYDDGQYKRDLFHTWTTVSGTCNTREYVLKRDGTNVVTDSACRATSGTWHSPYDGATWTAASDLDIDHMVPLKNAWVSGANTWSTAKRTQFANDIDNPQLWAVTHKVNEAKSDSSPDVWKPPLTSFYCTYSKSWVTVKYAYGLTVTSAEKSALASMLNTC